MSALNVTIDMVPARCKVMFVFSGPITAVYAENVDTGATGPLVGMPASKWLAWTVLDPDGVVGAP